VQKSNNNDTEEIRSLGFTDAADREHGKALAQQRVDVGSQPFVERETFHSVVEVAVYGQRYQSQLEKVGSGAPRPLEGQARLQVTSDGSRRRGRRHSCLGQELWRAQRKAKGL